MPEPGRRIALKVKRSGSLTVDGNDLVADAQAAALCIAREVQDADAGICGSRSGHGGADKLQRSRHRTVGADGDEARRRTCARNGF